MNDRISAQLRRVLCEIDCLAPSRQGLRIESVREVVNQRTGQDWHKRTIRRDLALLFDVGVIERHHDRFKLKRAESYEHAAISLLG